MPRPLSNDLRERIVEAIEGGESCHAAAERFDVALIVSDRPCAAVVNSNGGVIHCSWP